MKIELIKEHLGLPVGYVFNPEEKTALRLIDSGIAISCEQIKPIEAKSVMATKKKLDPEGKGYKNKLDTAVKNIQNKAE